MNEPKANPTDQLLSELNILVAAETLEQAIMLASSYSRRLQTLHMHFSEISANANTQRIQMEYCILQCLHIYAGYRLMELNPPEKGDAEAVDDWLAELDDAERKLHWGTPDRLEEWLTLQKLKVFLLAIKAHILVLANRNPSTLMSAVLHFACEMQNYKNVGEYGCRLMQSNGMPNPYFLELVTDPANLFPLAQAQCFTSPWNKCTMVAITAAYNHIMTKNSTLFSEADQNFVLYLMQCFTNIATFAPNTIPNVHADFLKRLCAEIPRVLLSLTDQVEPSLKQSSLNYGKLLFIRAQLLGLILAKPDNIENAQISEIYLSVQRRLEDKLPFLCLYRHFLNKPSLLRFVDVEIELEIDSCLGPTPSFETKEARNCLEFFRHLSDPCCDAITLMESALRPDSNNTKRLLIYFLIGASKDKKSCLQALKKIKQNKVDHPALIMGLTALDELLNPQAKADSKVIAVRNYFIEFKRLPPPPRKFFVYRATYFLVCQMGLSIGNAELSKMINEELFSQSANKTKAEQKSVDQLAQELSGPPKNDEKKKKKKKKNKKNGKKKTAPPENEPINPSNIEPAFVAHQFTREFTPAMPRSLFARKVKIINTKDSEQTYPRNIKEVTVPAVTAHELTRVTPVDVSSQRATPLDFCGYFALMQEYNPETIYQTKRTSVYPVSKIEAMFNARATFNNNGKYAMFSFGELHIGKPEYIDLIANCSLEEVEQLLALQQIEFKKNRVIMNMKFIPSTHPHFFITFENYPTPAPVRISVLQGATQKPLLELVRETQQTLGFLPLSLFRLSLGDKSFVIDFNQAVKTQKENPKELYLISENHDEKTAIINMLLAIEFLAKHPNYKASQALVAWIERNKYCLQNPQAIHPFVKLLFSGVACRGLLIMKQLDLLGGFFEPLEKLVEDPDFMAWVQNFDMYYSVGCKLTARVDYPSVFINVLAQFFFQVGSLPHHVNNGAQKAVFSHWSFWRSQQQHQQSQEATQQQQQFSPRLPERK